MSATEKADANGAAAELATLFPDRDIEVRDPETGAPVPLTVREFRFREGLEAQALARPLVAALAALVPADADAEMPDAPAIDAALGKHAEAWLRLCALACGREADWLARLGDADARALSDAMWAANGHFFIRRVIGAVATSAGTESLFRSLASLRTSPAPASATPPPSRTH